MRTQPQQFFLAVIEKQLPVGIRNVHAKHFKLGPKLETVCLALAALSASRHSPHAQSRSRSF